MKNSKILRYALIAIAIIILGGLLGWYIFLKNQSSGGGAADRARGYSVGTEQPTDLSGGGGGEASQSQGGSGGPIGFLGRMYNAILGVSDRSGSAGDSGNGTTGGLFDTNANPEDQGSAADVSGRGAGVATSTIAKLPRLWHVTREAVAGMRFLSKNGALVVRFVERSSGNVFDAALSSDTSTRQSNTLFPKTYRALVLPSGRVVVQTIENGAIVTFSGSLVAATSTSEQGITSTSSAQEIRGSSLPANMKSITGNDKLDGIIYVSKGPQTSSIIKVAGDGSKPTTLFSSTVSDWNIDWLSDGRVFVSEAAADGVLGHAYELRGGALAQIVSPALGLTISPRASSTALLWGSSPLTNLFVRASEGAEVKSLDLKSIADKCVWSPHKELVAYCGVPQGPLPGDFLNEWYRGSIHTADSIYEISVADASSSAIFTPDAGTHLDVSNITIDPSGEYLAFQNAADQSLYTLRIQP